MSETLTVSTAERGFDCYVARPDVVGTYPVIIVLQEIFGVNAGIRSIADNYAAKGYIAVAPDLFWREEPGVDLSEANEADVARAFALYKSYDFDHGVQDIAATISAARTMEGSNGKVGVTGYCLGGLMTYLSAARTDGDAFAAYYGGGTDNYLSEAKNIGAPFLYHLAGADEYIGPEAQEKIKEASNLAVQDLRRKAAKAFQSSIPVADRRARSAYLEDARKYLQAALDLYPQADQIPTVQQNLNVINKNLDSLASGGNQQ